ncbi:hypothetical protein K3495_g7020 [Podosphaera aphanis]|nr:hypothetical protein K3495_g7020 [Podosphaera aphanis]
MQYSNLIIAALGFGCAFAQDAKDAKDGVTVHVVKVGSSDNALTYTPSKVTANVGDMVQFQFASGNHTVTQSTFDKPCEPMSKDASSPTGIFSGFMPIPLAPPGGTNAAMMPTYTVMVKDKTPIWIYCSQAKHCQKGMAMVINENASKPDKSLENYVIAAKAIIDSPGAIPSIPGGSPGKGAPGVPDIPGVPFPSGKKIPSGTAGIPFPTGKPAPSGLPTGGGKGGGKDDGKKSGDNPPKNPFPSSGVRFAEIATSTLIGALVVVLIL